MRKVKQKQKKPTFGPSGYRLGDAGSRKQYSSGIIEWLMGVELMLMLAFIGRGSRGGVR